MKNIKYNKLFTPLKINNTMLKNRIIASPFNSHISKEKATGGASLIILSDDAFVSSGTNMTMLDLSDPMGNNGAVAARLKAKVDFWRQGGALTSMELLHLGEFGGFFDRPEQVYGVNAGIRPHDGAKIVEIDESIMNKICSEYGKSSMTIKSLGFDMITAHFSHGWLMSGFLSKTWNKRIDEYGGSYENRIRFPKMVLQSMRNAVGSNYPITMRINGKDWVGEDCNDIEEVARFLDDMYQLGLLDMVNISAGADFIFEGNVRMATHAIHPHLVNIEFSKYIKERTNLPVTVVGAIMTPEEAEMVIEEGYADAVWIGRAMLADSKWATKAYEDKADEIVPCLRCLYCNPLATNFQNEGCSVNPRFNKEEQYPVGIKTLEPKKVVVIGGGPAGLVAAITASEKGHQVTILEKENALGGVIRFTDYVKTKQDLNNYMKYLIRKVGKLNIDVKLNYEANYTNVSELNPDVIMVAVGADAITPEIKGMEFAIPFMEVFPKMNEMAKETVIIGGGTIGCEIAIDLAEFGKNVTVVELSPILNRTANMLYGIALAERMKEFPNIKTLVNTKCMEITENNVTIEVEGVMSSIEAETVIIATGLQSRTELANSFFGITPETYTIGDCKNVGIIMNATKDGFCFANEI